MNALNPIARQVKRLVSVLLASMLLMVTVACSNVDNPMASKTGAGKTSSYTEQIGSKTDLRDDLQPKRDGMNGYDDDMNGTTPAAQAKTRALVDRAQKNIKKTYDPGNVSEKVSKSVENLKDDVVEGTEKQKNNLVEGTKQGIRDIKGNLDKASRDIPEAIKDATDKVTSGAQQSADAVQKKGDALKRNIDKAA